MNKESTLSIPLPTIRRFPAYLRLLKDYASEGEEWVSATKLAVSLRLKPIQVRKDMACTGVEGKPKIGFEINELIQAIEHYLGWDNTTDAILIGAGNLGNALLGYKGFKNYGLQIVAVHDVDPDKIGRKVYGLKIQSMDKIEDSIRRLGVNIAILTVPEDFVQDIAERLVATGITGIWNFVPKNLKLPESVVVQRTDLATCFAELSSRLNQVLVRKKIDTLHIDGEQDEK